MSSGSLFMVLVLLSTLGPAPHSHSQASLTCSSSSRLKALPCKSSMIPLWTVAVLPDSGQHSLMSTVSDYKLATSFLDPVSVGSMVFGGLCVLLSLGVAAWTIITLVWITCTAVVSRINPFPRRRILISLTQCSKPGKCMATLDSSNMPTIANYLAFLYICSYRSDFKKCHDDQQYSKQVITPYNVGLW